MQNAARNTKQKALILDCLKSWDAEHVTAEEIVDRLKERGTPVAKSTVYRYLAQLEEGGEVRKYLLAEGAPACYQFVGEGPCAEHYHLMCQACGEIVHFSSPELERVLGKVNDDGGFRVDGVRTVFYGTCCRCTKAEVAAG